VKTDPLAAVIANNQQDHTRIPMTFAINVLALVDHARCADVLPIPVKQIVLKLDTQCVACVRRAYTINNTQAEGMNTHHENEEGATSPM
jgi:hypothetical protein